MKISTQQLRSMINESIESGVVAKIKALLNSSSITPEEFDQIVVLAQRAKGRGASVGRGGGAWLKGLGITSLPRKFAIKFILEKLKKNPKFKNKDRFFVETLVDKAVNKFALPLDPQSDKYGIRYALVGETLVMLVKQRPAAIWNSETAIWRTPSKLDLRSIGIY